MAQVREEYLEIITELILIFRLSTFYHYIANISIKDEKETIRSKKKFNKDKKTGLDEPDEPTKYRGSIKAKFDPNGDPYDSDDKSVISARISFMSRNSDRRTRLTLRFEDESIPSEDGKSLSTGVLGEFVR